MAEAEQQAALRRLYALARAELRDVLGRVDASDSAAVAEAIYTYTPIIAERYGLIAGTLAADWYEEMRAAAGVAGYFQAEMADLPTVGRYSALAGWAATKDDVETLVAGGLQRVIADMHRQTVMRSAFADPQAEGWARFAGGGDGSCPFCYMLISRGAVYTDRTAKFGSHDHCNCGAGPVWKGRAGTATVDDYRKSARRREDAEGKAISATKADQERAKDWIATNL